jgi:methionyl-tRNA formyltransferase
MKVVFMGTPDAAVVSLERLIADGHEVLSVYTQPDRPAGRGNKITASPVKKAAISHGLKVLQPHSLRNDDALEVFKYRGADVAVVVAYGRILPASFLGIYPYGCVNLHFSLLPKYRGAAPVNWAIVNRERETGVTTMKMDAGLDTGPILMQRSTLIGDNETSIELMERLAAIGADLLSETISDLEDLTPVPQAEAEASLAPIMKKADGLVDWSMSASEIAARVRGFQPFPTAFTTLSGSRLTLWQAEAADGRNGRCGEVVAAQGDDLVVSCGNSTALKIVELQPEGKRRMAARDLVNGGQIAVGDVLGA